MATILTQGTKEYLVVDVTDQLGTLTSLTGTTITFDVREVATQAMKYTSQAATFTSMRVYCLVDTTSGGNWAGGEYELWIKITGTPVNPEAPRLGPFNFSVNAE